MVKVKGHKRNIAPEEYLKKLREQRMKERVYLPASVVRAIDETPRGGCWICDMLSINIMANRGKHYFVKRDVIWDDGIKTHLEQLGWKGE